ncbi:MAG: YjgP/YjgQ family permease [Muribaculaceae bacterium]|nr:YjgP/YjgQ family permease [Muribaculaceae bacterium]
MLRIKRLDTFILTTFIPLLVMTFCICLFIVLMQFLWQYIDELVGKGLEIRTVLELFFYAAITFVPLALPLSVLLASLMVFGNLGEHFELTAMKSSGISLVRIMAPLIIFISIVAVSAFFFQNNMLPHAQVKMWTLLFSVRQKSPELDIPEGSFYNQITGYNIFVKQKNRETGMLHGMMIYDVSKGYGFANVMLADSGKLSFTADKRSLFLRLYRGEAFEDIKDGRPGGVHSSGTLFRRETFTSKDIVIPFDANFNRMDEGTMRQQYIGKDLAELRHTIDSVKMKKDSVGDLIANEVRTQVICGTPELNLRYQDTARIYDRHRRVEMTKPFSFDSIMRSINVDDRRTMLNKAIQRASMSKQEYEFKTYAQEEFNYSIRRHGIEMMKKFTLSLACIIFFFIGAPLGAIIRKGGLGAPIVISVFLFIFYYIVDHTGYTMARDGIWPVWQGMWLSSAVLMPLGIFLTHKAINDSAVFNADTYRQIFKQSFLSRYFLVMQTRNIDDFRRLESDQDPAEALAKASALHDKIANFLALNDKRQMLVKYWCTGYDLQQVKQIAAEVEDAVKYFAESPLTLAKNKAMDFPIINILPWYSPSKGNKTVGKVMLAIFPISIPLYFVGTSSQNKLKDVLQVCLRICDEISQIYTENKPK